MRLSHRGPFSLGLVIKLSANNSRLFLSTIMMLSLSLPMPNSRLMISMVPDIGVCGVLTVLGAVICFVVLRARRAVALVADAIIIVVNKPRTTGIFTVSAGSGAICSRSSAASSVYAAPAPGKSRCGYKGKHNSKHCTRANNTFDEVFLRLVGRGAMLMKHTKPLSRGALK